MKKVQLVITLFYMVFSVQAADFLKVRICYSDGRIVKGYASIPKSSGVKYIDFKPDETAKKQSIQSAELSKIVYYQNADSMIVERIATIKLINKSKTNDPIWMTKLIDGYTSLYVYYNAGYNYFIGNKWKNMPGDYQYACIRKGEPAASIVSMVMDGGISLNNNGPFKRYASEYFKDYAELSAKIEKKEYTFKDIEMVVSKYNEWKVQSK
jgi:hypothetical protein